MRNATRGFECKREMYTRTAINGCPLKYILVPPMRQPATPRSVANSCDSAKRQPKHHDEKKIRENSCDSWSLKDYSGQRKSHHS